MNNSAGEELLFCCGNSLCSTLENSSWGKFEIIHAFALTKISSCLDQTAVMLLESGRNRSWILNLCLTGRTGSLVSKGESENQAAIFAKLPGAAGWHTFSLRDKRAHGGHPKPASAAPPIAGMCFPGKRGSVRTNFHTCLQAMIFWGPFQSNELNRQTCRSKNKKTSGLWLTETVKSLSATGSLWQTVHKIITVCGPFNNQQVIRLIQMRDD